MLCCGSNVSPSSEEAPVWFPSLDRAAGAEAPYRLVMAASLRSLTEEQLGLLVSGRGIESGPLAEVLGDGLTLLVFLRHHG